MLSRPVNIFGHLVNILYGSKKNFWGGAFVTHLGWRYSCLRFYLFHVLPLGLFSKLCKNPFSVVFTCFWKKKNLSQFIQQQNAFRDSLIKQQMEFNKNLMSLMKSAGSSAAEEASRKRDDLDFFCCSEKYKVFELFREI